MTEEEEFENRFRQFLEARQVLDKNGNFISRLTEEQIDVLRIKFKEIYESNMTFENVGSQLGITPERVKEIEVKALRKLRNNRGNPDNDTSIIA